MHIFERLYWNLRSNPGTGIPAAKTLLSISNSTNAVPIYTWRVTYYTLCTQIRQEGYIRSEADVHRALTEMPCQPSFPWHWYHRPEPTTTLTWLFLRCHWFFVLSTLLCHRDFNPRITDTCRTSPHPTAPRLLPLTVELQSPRYRARL